MAIGKGVLICPQHWGLGHVTRTIPVIRYFIDRGYRVVLACSGDGSKLLAMEFPHLKLYNLPDYGMRYPHRSMYLNMLRQIAQMHLAIAREFFAIRRICQAEAIDLVVSDTRLGAAQPGIPSVMIAHHLHFPLGNRFFEWVSDVWLKFFYGRYTQVWIPDIAGEKNLSGELSHGVNIGNRHFIGILSRFVPMPDKEQYDCAFVLSGPEPQRSYLERSFIDQLVALLPAKCILVRGSKSAPPLLIEEHRVQTSLEVRDLVDGRELNAILCSSRQIVCRSGYSTLLDLCIIGKNALLIPTPGQPEQEYLARELLRKGLFHCVDQQDLDLPADLARASAFRGFQGIDLGQPLGERLDQLVGELFKTKTVKATGTAPIPAQILEKSADQA
jgi:hypothetical protein